MSCAHLPQPIPVRTAHRTQAHTHTGHGDKHTQAYRDGTRDSHELLPSCSMVFSCDSNSAQRLSSLQTDIRHACFVSRCLMWAVSWAVGLANSTLPFGIRHAHTVTRDAHTGPTRGAPAWAMGLPTMLGQCHMPSPPPGSAAIAPTGYAHAHVAALAHANPRAIRPSHARPLAVLTSASVVEPCGRGHGLRSRAGL